MFLNIAQRFFISITTLIAILVATFFLLHTIPGGPFDQERQLSPEIEKNLYEKYGLEKRGNQNFWVWFVKDCRAYGKYLLRGKLGPSLKYRDRDVGEIVFKASLPSLELGGLALMAAVTLSLATALFISLKPGGILDHAVSAVCTLFVALPSFVSAVILVSIFSLSFSFFPPALWEGPLSRVLPITTLTLAPLAYLLQLAKQGIAGELRLDYVTTAKAKGVPQKTILIKHVLRNALTPVLSIIGPLTAALITGSFVVESVFAIPGLGKHFVTAVIDRDYFLVMGITLFYSVILIGLNWMVDIGYGLIDPRMRK